MGINTILAEAGVAKMTLYNHFASKEELIIAIFEKRDLEFRASLMAKVQSAGPYPEQSLLAVFDWLEGWFGSEGFKGCVFIRAISEYPETTQPIHQAAWRHKVAVKTALTELCVDAGAKDAEALAETLSFLIDGAMVTAHATQTTAPARSARATAAQLLKLANT